MKKKLLAPILSVALVIGVGSAPVANAQPQGSAGAALTSSTTAVQDILGLPNESMLFLTPVLLLSSAPLLVVAMLEQFILYDLDGNPRFSS